MRTSTDFTPYSHAARPAFSAATCAANGVDLREPRKPRHLMWPTTTHALTIRNRHDRVVERRLHVHDGIGDARLAFLVLATTGLFMSQLYPDQFFLMARRGPCGYAHWCRAGRAPADRGDGACRDRCRSIRRLMLMPTSRRRSPLDRVLADFGAQLSTSASVNDLILVVGSTPAATQTCFDRARPIPKILCRPILTCFCTGQLANLQCVPCSNLQSY